MSSTHTYLVFQSTNKKACKDIIIDVTYQQFLIITEWMGNHIEELTNKAEQSNLYLDRFPKSMVGTDDDFQKLFTEESLQYEMDLILSNAGYSTNHNGGGGSGDKKWPLGMKPWMDPTSLQNMNHLRNNIMMTLNNPQMRSQHCGLPTQALESNPQLKEFL